MHIRVKNSDWHKVTRAWAGWNRAHAAHNIRKMKEYQIKLFQIYNRLGIKARRKVV